MKYICILGAGGHCKAIIDSLNLENKKILILDDNKNLNQKILNYTIFGKINNYKRLIEIYGLNNISFICSIGDSKIRREIVNKINKTHSNINWINVIHKTAYISIFSNIGKGTFIGPFVFIGPNCNIGNYSIINTKSSVDHDTNIGDFVHIAPGSTICGHVNILNNTFVGAGTTIKDHINIGNNVIIGCSSNVIRDVINNQKIYGNPAK